ncbi:DUF1003 domain-containing protein [Leucobacter sp. USHLN153]|uniref:DUF1003 domain-containing protein n=1 Tax=Leucobacter sp. USHLN153 TaxID=3081268 RepID=UPI00301AF292
MSLFKRNDSLDAPLGLGSRATPVSDEHRSGQSERFGRWTESIARGMGTPWFLFALTIVCVAWLTWNTYGPEAYRFDSAALGFTALTLILSLQASYAAPLLLLAQNRQDDRDRVQIEQDRQRAERNLADTEFLAREVVALRLALKELPDRDFVRAELKSLLAELAEDDSEEEPANAEASRESPGRASTTRSSAQPTERN